MFMKKRVAVVDILGGFGNQLFQLAFANDLKNKGFSVYVNLFNLRRVEKERDSIITNRNLILPLSYFDLEELSYKDFIKYDLIDKLKLSKHKIFSKNKLFSNYFSWFNDKNINLNITSVHNRFTGYWQSLELLEQNKFYLINALKKDSSILEALNNNPVKGSTALHVRRGDYIKISENLSNDYYEKALEYAKNNIKNFHFEIFSDDVDWVKKNNIFKSAIKIQPFENSLENTKDSFANMMKNENFIISNSSFSLMAAFLNESENSKIIFPDPWFRNQNYQKLSKKKWIPIVNN